MKTNIELKYYVHSTSCADLLNKWGCKHALPSPLKISPPTPPIPRFQISPVMLWVANTSLGGSGHSHVEVESTKITLTYFRAASSKCHFCSLLCASF